MMKQKWKKRKSRILEEKATKIATHIKVQNMFNYNTY